MDLLSEIILNSKIHTSRIFNITIFGSRVYGNFNNMSDYDVIIVANNSVESVEIKNGVYNIQIYTPDKFKKELNWHKPNVIECYFAPTQFTLKKNINFDLIIDKAKLRHATSHVSSNSWVKAKKKMLLNNNDDYYIGIKSLFHSLRIPMFSTQIATSGRITDFTCANHIWDKIISKSWTWEEIDREFRSTRNEILTNFRKVSEK